MSLSLPPSASPALPEIWLAGFLKSGLGLGESSRLIARSLEAANIPVVTHAWEKSDVSTVPFAGTHAPSTATNPRAEAAPGISILSLNGDQLSRFRNGEGKAFFDNRYVASIWFWELESLPARMVDGFQYLDEVWAPTPFVQAALQRHSGDVPVKVFTHPVPIPSGDAASARQRFPFEDRFVFLFTFDYQSCAKRKNPSGVCEAFVQAFPQPLPGGPLCIIKSINGSLYPVDLALMRHRWAHRPDIIVWDEFLSVEDRDLLTWRADACVSLHRSEGLGLTLMEAMAVGKPCIATAYSGNLAFMKEEHSWLIPSTRVPVGRGSVHYEPTQIWADPDTAAAAAAMREIFRMSPAVQAKAQAGMDYVRTRHSPLACGQGLATLLHEAAGKKPRVRPVASPPSRAAAYATLAALREKDGQPGPSVKAWRLPAALREVRRDSASTARMERRALSHALAALKEMDEAHRLRVAQLQGQIERLSDHVAEVIRLLPGEEKPFP